MEGLHYKGILMCFFVFLIFWSYSITVEQDISADTLFSRLVDFAVSRILIFADASTEHSTSTLLFYCRNEKTVSISYL